MADTSLVQVVVPEHVKDRASAVLAAAGLTISDAVQRVLERIADDQTLPFEPFTPNADTIAAIEEGRHRGLERFTSVDDLMADLRADD